MPMISESVIIALAERVGDEVHTLFFVIALAENVTDQRVSAVQLTEVIVIPSSTYPMVYSKSLPDTLCTTGWKMIANFVDVVIYGLGCVLLLRSGEDVPLLP